MLNSIEYEEYCFDPIPAFKKIQKFLSKFTTDDWENPHRYLIEEYFPIGQPETYIPNRYELYNITLSIEDDGVVYFDDAEEILLEAMYNNTPLPLQTIIMDKVIDASINEYFRWITISFTDGYVRIYY